MPWLKKQRHPESALEQWSICQIAISELDHARLILDREMHPWKDDCDGTDYKSKFAATTQLLHELSVELLEQVTKEELVNELLRRRQRRA